MPRPPGTARLALLLLLAAGAAGCRQHVSGNGVLAQQACSDAGGHTDFAFTGVKLGLGFEATITVDPLAARASCQVSGDANLIENLSFGAPGGVLQAVDAPSFDRILPLKLVVTAPALSSVEASDAGAPAGDFTAVSVKQAATQVFTVTAADRAQVTLAGPGAAGGSAVVALANSAVLHAFDYPVSTATVALANQASAELTASGAVTGAAAGSSSVTLHGGGTCSVTLSGSATCTAGP